MKSEVPSEIKRAALHFLKRGQMTIAQVAHRAGVSREAVRLWAGKAGIDIDKSTGARLDTLWRARIMSYSRIGQARRGPPE